MVLYNKSSGANKAVDQSSSDITKMLGFYLEKIDALNDQVEKLKAENLKLESLGGFKGDSSNQALKEGNLDLN